jgi:hypothetical protein
MLLWGYAFDHKDRIVQSGMFSRVLWRQNLGGQSNDCHSAPVGGVTISTAPLVSAWLRGTGGRFAAVTQALIGPPRRTLTPEVGGVELVILKRCLWYRCGRLCA